MLIVTEEQKQQLGLSDTSSRRFIRDLQRQLRMTEMTEELQRAILDAGGYVTTQDLLQMTVNQLLDMLANNSVTLFAYWRMPIDAILRQKQDDQDLIDRINQIHSNNLKGDKVDDGT